MFCPKCGNEISEEDKTCSKCGCDIISDSLNADNEKSGINDTEVISNNTKVSIIQNTKYYSCAKVSYFFSLVPLFIGFYKLFAYKNNEYSLSNINAYVGGDAYNYIINAGYACSYFILFLSLFVLGSALLICNEIVKSRIK